jgi:hypothetical protein
MKKFCRVNRMRSFPVRMRGSRFHPTRMCPLGKYEFPYNAPHILTLFFFCWLPALSPLLLFAVISTTHRYLAVFLYSAVPTGHINFLAVLLSYPYTTEPPLTCSTNDIVLYFAYMHVLIRYIDSMHHPLHAGAVVRPELPVVLAPYFKHQVISWIMQAGIEHS